MRRLLTWAAGLVDKFERAPILKCNEKREQTHKVR